LEKWVVKMLSDCYWFLETSEAHFWSEKVRPLKVSELQSILYMYKHWYSKPNQIRNILIYCDLSLWQGLTLSQYGIGMR